MMMDTCNTAKIINLNGDFKRGKGVGGKESKKTDKLWMRNENVV
jgi:hypothetical protein